MAQSTKILVFHVPAGGGHKAAARAIAESAAARGLSCEVVDALALTPRWFARAYVETHLRSTEHTPAFYGHGYAALNQRHALVDGVRGAFDRAIGTHLLRFAASRTPSAIISTHFFPLAVLGHARKTGKLDAPLLGVVTDYAAHAFWAEPGVDRFCAPAGKAARDLVRHGAHPETIVATGIPILSAFAQIPALILPTRNEALRILITSGGFGVGPMIDVIRSFAGIPAVKLTIVCGNNPGRVEQAKRAALEAEVPTELVGFEHDMPRRMAQAHLIVGKPGGLTVSEALAAGRPMVIVGACPGQETMNQSFLVAQGAAIAVSPEDTGRSIASLRARGVIGQLATAARSLAAPRAADRVVENALWLGASGSLPRPWPSIASAA